MGIFIIKHIGHRCNLDCEYCYYCEEDEKRNEKKIMNHKILESLFLKSFKYYKDRIDFVWHGGEPLLAGRNFFQNMLRVQNKFTNKYPNIKVINGIQTNATLINDNWAELFAKYKFSVGVSCDGPEQFHNVCRVDKNGKGSFSNFLKGWEFLKKKKIKVGAICVVTKASVKYPEELCEFFYNQGFMHFHPKPCYEIIDGKLTESSITPGEYLEFMIKAFDWWIKKNDPKFEIRNLKEIVKVFIGGKANLCEFTGNCGLFLTVNYNGDIGPCDSFPAFRFNFGNIVDQSWEDIFQSAEYKNFLIKIKQSREKCFGCEWQKVCHGGCLRYSYNYTDDSWHHNVFCEAKKELFSYIKKRVDKLIPQISK